MQHLLTKCIRILTSCHLQLVSSSPSRITAKHTSRRWNVVEDLTFDLVPTEGSSVCRVTVKPPAASILFDWERLKWYYPKHFSCIMFVMFKFFVRHRASLFRKHGPCWGTTAQTTAPSTTWSRVRHYVTVYWSIGMILYKSKIFKKVNKQPPVA